MSKLIDAIDPPVVVQGMSVGISDGCPDCKSDEQHEWMFSAYRSVICDNCGKYWEHGERCKR